MSFVSKFAGVLVGIGICFAGPVAHAVPVAHTYQYTGNVFASGPYAGERITGSFTLNLDPAIDVVRSVNAGSLLTDPDLDFVASFTNHSNSGSPLFFQMTEANLGPTSFLTFDAGELVTAFNLVFQDAGTNSNISISTTVSPGELTFVNGGQFLGLNASPGSFSEPTVEANNGNGGENLPEPGMIGLLGVSILGLGMIRRQRRNS